MIPTPLGKALIVLAGTAVVAGGSTALHVAQAGGTAAVAQQEPGAQAGEQQEPDEFRLVDRERTGQDGRRVLAGNSQAVFDSIFEFTDSVNDLFVWGWMPTISGQIADNAFLGGQKVEITRNASIGGDLFLFAQTARIDTVVRGDLYAFVAELTIGQGGSVEGAVYGSAGTLTIDGQVTGPLRFAGGVVTINGTVRDDVRIEAGELELGPDAVIEGELRYESPREATIDPGARVEGEVHYYPPREEEEGEEPAASRSLISFWSVLWDTWWLVSSFLVGAIALAIGGEAARRPAARLVQQPALGLGFGFVVAVVIPAAAILAVLLLVTIPLGLITGAVYLAAAYLARLVAAQAVGGVTLRLLRSGEEPSPYLSLAIGLVLFFFLTQIPYVGFLIWLAAVVAGLGGIFLATRKSIADEPGAPLPTPTLS